MSEQSTRSAYDLEPGERFELGGAEYLVTGAVTGEFNAYVPVVNETHGNGARAVIVVRHGVRVTMLEPALTSAPPVSPT